ncbi:MULTISPECIES: hypothetical protein [unclassified Acinetobacter]|uniref:hypothetical protein n=1 Tax=unclassified Acinetobacter TaxID=196816 RepID=UPI00244AA1ED|nr:MULTISPECIES: hypothetical protein [unclassified Acinetobacter]MDH0032052.1 hypothetical protein [Acinetobacter sp. GD04021]MDH0887708.1 hypothetical protein [Acinetobacter sp. GD03873]MDH1084056.1 hypothetical protein [Acinetobacter sp. GD03983]MDH2191017.1 hypothetical protein [Acinetobacter sp. GD03645]MDH2204568.1 hypothetical protein [Acinetobacter sp. GD03647]
MDLQKERLAFERLPLAELAIKSEFVYYNEETNSYWPNEDFCPSDAPETMNFAWEAWQAAIARMEVRIDTLDEMLLNQGEALAQAKAQAVMEITSVGNELQSWVAVWSFKARHDHEDYIVVDANLLAEKIEKLTGANA